MNIGRVQNPEPLNKISIESQKNPLGPQRPRASKQLPKQAAIGIPQGCYRDRMSASADSKWSLTNQPGLLLMTGVRGRRVAPLEAMLFVDIRVPGRLQVDE